MYSDAPEFLVTKLEFAVEESALNVSVRLLHLRFREVGGGTLRGAVAEARLAAVCERLRASDDPVDAVAAECGFASVSHLAAAFRRRFGLTMARWRAHHRAGGRPSIERSISC